MNQTMIQYFHWYTKADASLWQEVAEQAGYLAELGINLAWLPPAYKGSAGHESVGYDAYDLFDLGEFEQKGSVATKYGTKEQYQHAVHCLREKGVGAVVDIVLNHKAGGDELEQFQVVKVDPENREVALSDPYEIRGYTRFTFPGRSEQYSNFKWDYMCFSGVDYAEGESEHAIYRIMNGHGDGWEDVVGDELGNYDYLMFSDIDHRNVEVRKELNYWGKWYYDQIGFAGVRLDALKHQSPDFYKEWLQLLRSNTGQNLFAVGEYWAPGKLEWLEEYMSVTEGCMNLFDCSLQLHLHTASHSEEPYDLRTIFEDTLVGVMPDKAVTFIDNHDTQPLQALEAPVAYWFKPIAYALILLRAGGTPCVFYPDLFGAHYTDKGGDEQEHEIFLDKVEGIEALLKIRQQHAYGTQRDYFDEPHCIGWTREGDETHDGCAVVVSNHEGGHVSMAIGQRYAGQQFYDQLGHSEEIVVVDEAGVGVFSAPAKGVGVWLPKHKV